MIDRLVHHAEVIALKGDSYRLKDRDLGRVPPAATEHQLGEEKYTFIVGESSKIIGHTLTTNRRMSRSQSPSLYLSRAQTHTPLLRSRTPFATV